MKFLKKLIKTNREIEGDTSLLIHSLVGCNLNCFGCHNKMELVDNCPTEHYTEEQIIEIIKSNGYFFDSIIFSGGEITLNNNLENFLKKVKDVYSGKIILYSNGTNPSKIKDIINIVDGIYIDIKYDIQKEDTYNILGVAHNKEDIISTLDLVYSNNKKRLSGFRTVKYPQYSDSYLEDLKLFINKKYPNIEYKQNEFQN